jgi:aminoglycoside/choline kinase family phosphotransferase
VRSVEQRLADLARVAARTPDSNAFAVEKLAGQASNRVYYRVAAASGSPSFVAMVLPQEAAKSEEATSASASAAELPFLNVHRYLAKLGIPVPAIHTAALDEGILLLEDLGDTTLELSWRANPSASLYHTAIDLLADLRAHAEAHPDPSCLAFTRGFDRALYRWEFDHYLEYGLRAREDIEPTARAAEVLRRAFDSISDRLVALPRGFTHRDYQSRNLMLPARGMVVIDFQDALLGPRQYDLVALLRDSYVELPDALLDSLLARYLERFCSQTRETIDPAEFRAGFDLLTVQRKLKDAGRFEFIARVKGNPSFLPHVPASFRYVARALERLPQYGDLLRLLRELHPEMRAG